MSRGKVSLKTPFVEQNFSSIDNFIMTIFPDLESYIKEQIAKGIQKSVMMNIVYSKLKDNFKFFIIRNYSKELDEYLDKETDNFNKEAMKNVLLSTISINLNVTDKKGDKLMDSDYLNTLRGIIQGLKV
jgi:hypothetical protein